MYLNNKDKVINGESRDCHKEDFILSIHSLKKINILNVINRS